MKTAAPTRLAPGKYLLSTRQGTYLLTNVDPRTGLRASLWSAHSVNAYGVVDYRYAVAEAPTLRDLKESAL